MEVDDTVESAARSLQKTEDDPYRMMTRMIISVRMMTMVKDMNNSIPTMNLDLMMMRNMKKLVTILLLKARL